MQEVDEQKIEQRIIQKWIGNGVSIHSLIDLQIPVNGYYVQNEGQYWYQNSKLHREDGPAIIHASGTQQWYLHGKLHRTDGPALICANGTQYWYLHGKIHREDGPAVIWADGHQEWWLNGKFHREDDSAVTYIGIGGSKIWYKNGKLIKMVGILDS